MINRRVIARTVLQLLLGACAGSVGGPRAVEKETRNAIAHAQVPLDDTARTTAALRSLVGSRRIVLLGENGHGVGSLTTQKVLLTRLLLDSLGFTVVAFESGYHECGEADSRLEQRSAVAALRDCFAYAFEHAEALPMIEHIRSGRRAGRDLRIAGVDYQPQGAASLTRPAQLRHALLARDSALAESVAATDSALLMASQAGGDSLRRWIGANAGAAWTNFTKAQSLVGDEDRWHLESALGLLQRGELRFAMRDSIPSGYYAARDEFMARSVSWIADSLGSARKVVVWMHNDHVRLRMLNTPSGPVESTGSHLARRYPSDVTSIGLFMGPGEVTNNSRELRRVLEIDPGSLEDELARSGMSRSLLALRGERRALIRRWAEARRRYLRNGVEHDSLVPRSEFDALVFTSRAIPPTYQLPAP